MSTPAVARVFFAIDLPDAIKQQVSQVISSLKKKVKSHGIRWTRPENLHITLQFLAEVQAEHVPRLVLNVQKVLAASVMSIPPLTLGKLHFFPNPYRPRVMVLDIDHQDELAALSKLIGQGIQASHYDIETRPFRAHLTIGRIKYAQEVTLSFLSEFVTSLQIDSFAVSHVILFRSDPEPQGSHYTLIDKIEI